MPSEIRVDSIQGTTSPYDTVFTTTGGALSHRNMMINGAMLVDQRMQGNLRASVGATDDKYNTLDMWRTVWAGNGEPRNSIQQVAITDLAGFSKAMKIDCTTAEGGTQGATEFFKMSYKFEGQDLQGLEKGFSTAKSFTISFWVKGTASRTYVLELEDSPNSRHLTQQFSVTASWVKHTYTIPGDTTGKIDCDNTEGLRLNLWFFAGGNYTGGTYTANTWKTTTANQRAEGISGSGKGLMTTTSDEVYFTGFQMELGSAATPFEHRSYGDEMVKCHRYYQNSYRLGQTPHTSTPTDADGQYHTRWNDGNVTGPRWTVQMRAAPVVVVRGYGANTTGQVKVNGGGTPSTTVPNINANNAAYLAIGDSTGAVWAHYCWEADAGL